MKRTQWMGQRTVRHTSNVLMIVGTIVLALWTVMAMNIRNTGALTRTDAVQAPTRQLAAADLGAHSEAAAHGGDAVQAATGPVEAKQQVDYSVQKRWELADTLRRQGERAWQAGEYRAAVLSYRQHWAVSPGFPPLDAAREKRWEIADRLQREANAAWQAGDERQAASLYRQSQAVLP